MEAGTLTEDLRNVEDSSPTVLPPEIEQAAQPQGNRAMSPEQQADALDWLLSDEEDESEARRVLELNVGTPRAERWIKWTIRPVDREVLRQIQRAAGGNRQQRRGRAAAEQVDPEEANLRIVARGTVDPDLTEAAGAKGVQQSADPSYGPMQILRWRFRHKPGLIDQIAGEVFDLSGYDEEDVREAKEVRAAGN